MDRSLLTPGIYGRAAQSQSLAYWEEIAGAVDQAFRCTYVLCETEDATQRERLLGRLEYHSKDGEDTIRRKLGEADLHFLDCVNKQYQRLVRVLLCCSRQKGKMVILCCVSTDTSLGRGSQSTAKRKRHLLVQDPHHGPQAGCLHPVEETGGVTFMAHMKPLA